MRSRAPAQQHERHFQSILDDVSVVGVTEQPSRYRGRLIGLVGGQVLIALGSLSVVVAILVPIARGGAIGGAIMFLGVGGIACRQAIRRGRGEPALFVAAPLRESLIQNTNVA